LTCPPGGTINPQNERRGSSSSPDFHPGCDRGRELVRAAVHCVDDHADGQSSHGLVCQSRDPDLRRATSVPALQGDRRRQKIGAEIRMGGAAGAAGVPTVAAAICVVHARAISAATFGGQLHPNPSRTAAHASSPRPLCMETARLMRLRRMFCVRGSQTLAPEPPMAAWRQIWIWRCK